MLPQRHGLAASPPLLYTFSMGRRTAPPFFFFGCWSLRRDVVKVHEVHVLPSAVLCNLEEVLDAGESAFTRESRRDLFESDRDDRVDLDLATLEAVSPPGAHPRADPDANRARDRTASHTIAEVFRELHRASLIRRTHPLHHRGTARHSRNQKLLARPTTSGRHARGSSPQRHGGNGVHTELSQKPPCFLRALRASV